MNEGGSGGLSLQTCFTLPGPLLQLHDLSVRLCGVEFIRHEDLTSMRLAGGPKFPRQAAGLAGDDGNSYNLHLYIILPSLV
jgi:hypothetical protein